MSETNMKDNGLPQISDMKKKTSRTKSATTNISSQRLSCRRSSSSTKPTEKRYSFSVHSAPTGRKPVQNELSLGEQLEPSAIEKKREKLKSGKFGPYFQNYFPGVSRRKPIEIREPSDDEDYDTDLEEQLEQEVEPEENDNTIFRDYKRLCRKLKVVPNNFFIRHGLDEKFTMRYRYPGYNDVRALMHDIQSKDTVSSLNLEDNGIGPAEMLHLSQMLLQTNSVQELNLMDNKIGTYGARLLKTVLLYNRHLVKIDISGNKIGEKGAKYCAELLERNIHLKEFNVAHNSIAENGALYLGQAISTNHTLDILDISWNNISPKGAVMFARGLKININLKVLKAAMNGFHIQGTEALADVLKVHQSLECLDISANRIPEEGAVAIARALQFNKGLKALKIGFNPLTLEGAEAILHSLSGKYATAVKEVDLEGVALNEAFAAAANKVIEKCNIDVIYVVQPSRRSKSYNQLNKLVTFLNENNVMIGDLFDNVKETNIILSPADIVQRFKKTLKDVSEEKISSLQSVLSDIKSKRFLLQDLLDAAQQKNHKKDRFTVTTPIATYSPRPAKNPKFGRLKSSLWWSQTENAWGDRLVGTDMKVPPLLTT